MNNVLYCFILTYPSRIHYLYTYATRENNLVMPKARKKWEFISPHTAYMKLSSIRHLQHKWHHRLQTNTHAEVSLQTRLKNDTVNKSFSHVMQARPQQQPNDDCWFTGVLELILMLDRGSAADDAAGPTRDLISAAIVTNACSTLVAFFALVSRNGMRSWSAYSYRHQTHHRQTINTVI